MLNLSKQLSRRLFSDVKNTNNVDILYQMSKQTKTPFFTIPSHLIEIIDDPLEFYLNIHRETKQAINRIGLSSLYLGNGSLERFLFKSMIKRAKTVPTLNITMVFDYNRSKREENGDSSVDMMKQYFLDQLKKRVTISFNKQSISAKSILGQVQGVHHQKIALFDDTLIMGGANLSHSYFTNRRDRYIKIRECGQLADYLYDYLKVLSQNGYRLTEGLVCPPLDPNLENHYKLWKYSYSPAQYKESLSEQQAQLDRIRKQKQFQANKILAPQNPIPKNKNVILAQILGTEMKIFEPIPQAEKIIKRNRVREKLFNVGDQNDVGNQIMEIQQSGFSEITEIGQKVYIFPFMQFPRLKEKMEPQVLVKILQNSIARQLPIRISSGYMNFTDEILNELILSKRVTQVLCSAPEANSFYRGGILKQYIPYFYRNLQGMILQKWSEKIQFKQYLDGQWSFHAKGIWIKQDDNNYLTVVGSSNFNARSKNRDTQLQLYMYSTCPAFNNRLDRQWKDIEKNCKLVCLENIKKDEEIKYNKVVNLITRMVARFL